MEEMNTNTNVETLETTDTPTETTDELIFDELQPHNEEEQPKVEPEQKPLLKVKYNGAEQELAYEDAIPLVQKGMNYDKLQQRYESIKNAPELQMITKQAESLGMTSKEYVEYLEDFQIKSLENKALQGLMAQYPDAEQELLAQLARTQVNEYLQEKEQERNQQSLLEEKEEDQWWFNQIERFMNVYPDVDMENLPPEVLDLINEGDDVLSAYRAYENNLLRQQLKATEQNMKNKDKATGNLTQSVQVDSGDLFLQGLLGK